VLLTSRAEEFCIVVEKFGGALPHQHFELTDGRLNSATPLCRPQQERYQQAKSASSIKSACDDQYWQKRLPSSTSYNFTLP
jgi:hypothetical protein